MLDLDGFLSDNLRMKTARKSTRQNDSQRLQLSSVAAYLNGHGDTDSGKRLQQLQALCLEYAESRGASGASAVNRFLAAYPMRVVVSSAELFNGGVPFFNYIPSGRLKGNASDGVTVADMQLPNVIVGVLRLMQDGKLNLLRHCEYCQSWIMAQRKDQRWCAAPKPCKRRWHEGTPAYKAEAARRKRERYRADKERDVRDKQRLAESSESKF